MKQAGRWLLLAAAFVLVPQPARAQKKPPKGGNTGAPAAPAGGNPAPADADADADQSATPASSGANSSTPATDATPAGEAGGSPDICQITPDLPQCQAAKEINLNAEAKKPVKAEIYAVQQQYVIKAHRFEIMPYFAFSLNDQFVAHDAPGLSLNYYITQVLAIGLTGNWYGGLNSENEFNFENRRSARISVPLNEYQASADLNFTYVPIYGKYAGFGDFIFHYDAYIEGGFGLIRTRPIAVIDPDNRKFDWNNNLNFDVGIGFRIFFTRWLAATLEVRDLMYLEKLESITVAAGPATTANGDVMKNGPLDKQTWYSGDQPFTNDVQLQVGLSFFLPTSFEYRLPK